MPDFRFMLFHVPGSVFCSFLLKKELHSDSESIQMGRYKKDKIQDQDELISIDCFPVRAIQAKPSFPDPPDQENGADRAPGGNEKSQQQEKGKRNQGDRSQIMQCMQPAAGFCKDQLPKHSADKEGDQNIQGYFGQHKELPAAASFCKGNSIGKEIGTAVICLTVNGKTILL